MFQVHLRGTPEAALKGLVESFFDDVYCLCSIIGRYEGFNVCIYPIVLDVKKGMPLLFMSSIRRSLSITSLLSKRMPASDIIGRATIIPDFSFFVLISFIGLKSPLQNIIFGTAHPKGHFCLKEDRGIWHPAALTWNN
ncbi:MAG: hypothetical protein ABC360_03860 [Acetomicrobium sp.]